MGTASDEFYKELDTETLLKRVFELLKGNNPADWKTERANAIVSTLTDRITNGTANPARNVGNVS